MARPHMNVGRTRISKKPTFGLFGLPTTDSSTHTLSWRASVGRAFRGADPCSAGWKNPGGGSPQLSCPLPKRELTASVCALSDACSQCGPP